MILLTENLHPRVTGAVNFPVLEDVLHRFRTPHATGTFVLTLAPMHRHVRLEFRGSGVIEGVLLRGPLFNEDLLLQPGSVARLIDQAVAFLVTVEGFRPEAPAVDLPLDETAAALA